MTIKKPKEVTWEEFEERCHFAGSAYNLCYEAFHLNKDLLNWYKEYEKFNKITISEFREQQNKIDKLKKALEFYAGVPFDTNNLYIDIFDLIHTGNDVVEFEKDKFTEEARKVLKEVFNE